MTDLSKTIEPKSDQLNSDDLISGPRTITVTSVKASPSSPEQPVSIHFDGDGGKPYKPCKSMRRVMVQLWGSDGAQYVGRSMTLYRDPKVKWGGIEVGGIRISHMSHIDGDTVLSVTESKAKRSPFRVRALVTAEKRPAKETPPPKEPGNITQALEMLETATVLTVDTIRDRLLEFSWSSDEGKQIKAAVEKATGRKA
jgi:hypothetical protein